MHSERFVLVDRYARIRGVFSVLDPGTFIRSPESLPAIEAKVREVMAETAIPVAKLPRANMMMNASSGVLLLTGLGLIKAKKPAAHRAAMLVALGVSLLFLASYLTVHHFVGATPYPGLGWRRPLYFTILISHTVLAAVVAPLAMITVYHAFGERFDRHRAIARWTFPIWLYVSITGVIIYFMLY